VPPVDRVAVGSGYTTLSNSCRKCWLSPTARTLSRTSPRLTSTETAPVHLRGVAKLFVAKLDDQELAVLKDALDKVTVDCTFG
jgi:hypothetical protein